MILTRTLALILAPGLMAGPAGCAPVAETDEAPVVSYRGIEAQALDTDLVDLRVAMSGTRDEAAVTAYATCAAARYALDNGSGFVRHIRTNVSKEGSIWRADAVYMISPALPRGLKTIDAEVTIADCAEQGIPTV